MDEALRLVGAMFLFVGAVVVTSGILFAVYFCQDVYRIKHLPKEKK